MRSGNRLVRGGDDAMSVLSLLQDPPPSRFKAASATIASGTGVKAVVIAFAGLAGVTAASAGISSLRRRQKKPKDAS
jgi:hypothetical protein